MNVRGHIVWPESEVCVVEHVATVFLNSARARPPGHDEKADAVFV